MTGLGKRTWFPLGLAVLSVPLVAAALAYGCTAAAILSSTPGSAVPGGTVTVTGKYFKTHASDIPGSASAVQIRLGRVDGPVLATATPQGQDRAFTVRIKVPSDAAVGHTLLTGTQYESNGTPVYGTPARQAFKVTAAAAPRPAVPSPVVNRVVTRRVATLSMASARRKARSAVLRRHRRAKQIRTRCARRSRTSAVCRVRFKVGPKSYSRKVVVRSKASSAAW